MSEHLEVVLRKSLDEVTRTRKINVALFVAFALFALAWAWLAYPILLVHMNDVINIPLWGVHGSARDGLLLGAAFTAPFMILFATYAILCAVNGMTKKILKAIELSSKQ
jgi:hypothetical protein